VIENARLNLTDEVCWELVRALVVDFEDEAGLSPCPCSNLETEIRFG